MEVELIMVNGRSQTLEKARARALIRKIYLLKVSSLRTDTLPASSRCSCAFVKLRNNAGRPAAMPENYKYIYLLGKLWEKYMTRVSEITFFAKMERSKEKEITERKRLSFTDTTIKQIKRKLYIIK